MPEPVKINTTLSASAVKFISRMVRFAQHTDAVFQINLQPGGCSGYSVSFDVAASPVEGESVWVQDGIRFSSTPQSLKLLDGATVDFVETLSNTGFVVTRPGAAADACSTASTFVPVSLLIAK